MFSLFYGYVRVGERMKISVAWSGWNIRCRGNIVSSISVLFFLFQKGFITDGREIKG
jgi:hypothetical protein